MTSQILGVIFFNFFATRQVYHDRVFCGDCRVRGRVRWAPAVRIVARAGHRLCKLS